MKEPKVLYHLEKPRSRYKIIFVEDLAMDPDGWFIDVQYRWKKDDKIERSSCIILKDVKAHLSPLLREGWEIIESQ